MTISSLAPVEEKYSSVKQLIELGKEKGYLLYDEIYEMLPEEVVSLPTSWTRSISGSPISGSTSSIDPSGTRTGPTSSPARTSSTRKRTRRRNSVSPPTRRRTTRSACTCARWARSRCSPARARSRSPSASRTARRMIYEAPCDHPVVREELLRLGESRKDKRIRSSRTSSPIRDERLDPKSRRPHQGATSRSSSRSAANDQEISELRKRQKRCKPDGEKYLEIEREIDADSSPDRQGIRTVDFSVADPQAAGRRA